MKCIMIDDHKNLKSQLGAAMVEMALVLLLFLTIIFGIIEFGLLMYNQHIITNSAREGARHGIVSRVPRVTETEIIERVTFFGEQNIVTFGSNNFDVNVINQTTGATQCEKFSDELQVTSEYTYTFLFLPFVERDLASNSTMRCE